MPLSSEQMRSMDIHIRSNTIYGWPWDGASGRLHIIRSIEQVMDSSGNLRCDLFLPNCFINGCENSAFWFKMAAIASSYEATDWHEIEYGPPLGTEDPRQRCVYSWSCRGDAYKFYTKQLHDERSPELVWFFGATKCDIDSSDETDSENIMLHLA